MSFSILRVFDTNIYVKRMSVHPDEKQRGITIKRNTGNYDSRDAIRVMVEPKWHHSCQHCGLEDE
jgi:hypothetical protein